MQQLLCIDCKYFKIITEHIPEYDSITVGCSCIYMQDRIVPNLHGYTQACPKFKVKEDYLNEMDKPEQIRY